MYMSPASIEALYTSIHRLAQSHIPDCTIEQVKKVANRFHDQGSTRLQCAFLLYWELTENRVENSIADRFLELLRIMVDSATRQKQEKQIVSVRDYWQ